MAEYIERDALIDDLDAAAKHGGMGAIIAQTLQRYVKRAPAADVAPVRHGRWIEYTKVIIPEPYNKWEQAWKCSECGFDDGFVAYNYCPNCGARMDGARNGEED